MLDREAYANGTFTFKIRAEIIGVAGTAYEQTITVTLADANDAPTAIAFAESGVVANVSTTAAADHLIGLLHSVDQDVGDTHSYVIVDGQGSHTPVAPNGAFKVDASGQLLVDNPAALGAAGTHTTIWVQSTDGVAFAWQELTINLLENVRPDDILVTGGTITEKATLGAVAATLATSDQAGDTHHYDLVADQAGDPLPNGHPLFEIENGSNKITLKAALDDAQIGAYDLWVKTTDSEGLFYINKVTITVTNVAEVPTGVKFEGHNVLELAAAGSEVGSLTTIDPDPARAYTYSLDRRCGRALRQFRATRSSSRTGSCSTHEQAASHTITVRSHGRDRPLASTRQFVISVGDVARAKHTAGSAPTTCSSAAPRTTPLAAASVTIA